MKTKFKDLQEAWRRFAVPPSMIDVVDFGFERVLAVVAVDAPAGDALLRTAEVSRLQLKYDRLAAQLSSVTSQCDTWRWLA